MNYKGLGILFRPHTGFIDHLVPLTNLLDIPILANDFDLSLAIELHYPECTKVIYSDDPETFLKDAEYFIYVEPYRIATGGFSFEDILHKRNVKSLATLHGNSDKGRDSFWAEKYANEPFVLLYGPHMRDFFEEKGVLGRIPSIAFGGNYRYLYYKENKTFFDHKVKNLPTSDKRINLLYTPTWVDRDPRNQESSPFFDLSTSLFDHIPEEFQLFVKLHPYFYKLYPKEIADLQEKYNIHFLPDTPLIYPILNKMDALIGDFSSISYDFLAFDRPLFFLIKDREKKSPIFEAGEVIDDFKNVYERVQKGLSQDKFSEKRKNLYRYAFGESEIPIALLRERLRSGLES